MGADQQQPRPSFVSTADDDLVHVTASDSAAIETLSRAGFAGAGGGEYVRRVNDDVEKGRVFTQLRDAGVAFARGREWNPAEVFEWLREQGYVAGTFRSIAWRGPDEWIVREE